jgi:pyruvate-formate lyase
MIQLSSRCETLKNAAVNDKPYRLLMCGQRDYHFLKGMFELPKEKRTNPTLIASGLAAVLRNSLPIIQEGELIVGYNYGDGGYEWLPENIEAARPVMALGGFSDAEIDWYFTHKEEAQTLFTRVFPQNPPSPKEIALDKELSSLGGCLTDNHSVIGYERVLKLGFEGLKKEVESYLSKNGSDFYEAIQMVCDAGCLFGERYAQQASEMLVVCEDNHRKDELASIIQTCGQVPRSPARTFREAVQSLWFAHIINTWEDGINANSLGRLDQILYPYYKTDLENGTLTRQDAFEIICCLWIKLYRDYDVQQSCVGGTNADGSSAVNALSYLMLDATEALNFVRCLSVRFSPATEKQFIQRALEVVGHVQKGIPFFFNDEVMIKALTNQGIAYEDAVGYTQIGCVETVIPGKSNPHAVTARCNLLKAMEYSLANGKSMISPDLFPGLETGLPQDFTTFNALKTAVFKQMRHIIQSACQLTIRWIPPAATNSPKPYKSLLTEGCLETGMDFNARGAKYDYYQVMLLGIPNLADSLAAVRDLVYAQKKYSLSDLIYQLENDFPDEAIRLDFVNKAPKFGNDLEEVDSLAVEILDFACDTLKDVSIETGYAFHAQPFTFLWMVDHGRTTAATPDGRRKGEILAYSVSPMQGRDFNGFTALMNSISKLPTTKTPGSASAIVEVDPKLFSDRNLPFFVEILLSAAKKGLCNVQFNTVDAGTLIEAQKHPDQYKNLAVRVSGFSQKFYLLDKTIQDHIICRTKHQSL